MISFATKIQTKLTPIFCSMLLLVGFVAGGAVVSQVAYAQDNNPQNNACPAGYTKNLPNLADDNPDNDEPCIPAKIPNSGDPATRGDCKLDCIVNKYVNPATRLLAGLIGLVAAISLVYAGIQYSSAGGDPGKVQAARKRIMSTVLALLAFLFLFAFLQWLVPGGVF